MANYTEFKFTAKLSKSTPTDVIELLHRVIVEFDIGLGPAIKGIFKSEDVPRPNFEHPFFECRNWYMLLVSTNWGGTEGSKFEGPNQAGSYIIDIHTEFTDYDGEIVKFMDWITPYVSGRKKKQYVGYEKWEQADQRINIYINR